jgi:hypothetical protein
MLNFAYIDLLNHKIMNIINTFFYFNIFDIKIDLLLTLGTFRIECMSPGSGDAPRLEAFQSSHIS